MSSISMDSRFRTTRLVRGGIPAAVSSCLGKGLSFFGCANGMLGIGNGGSGDVLFCIGGAWVNDLLRNIRLGIAAVLMLRVRMATGG
jgi:hypothetical protein